MTPSKSLLLVLPLFRRKVPASFISSISSPLCCFFAPVFALYRELFQKECSKLASVGMTKKGAQSVDEKSAIITKKYEKPILSKAEDADMENAEHMYELEFNGDLPPSVVG